MEVWAAEGVSAGTRYDDRSYERGVLDTLRWLRGEGPQPGGGDRDARGTRSGLAGVRGPGLGGPGGEGRPRAALFGKKGAPQGVRVFEAPVDRDWKQIVMGQAVMHRPPAPLEGPLALEFTFRMPMPKAMPKRVRVAIAEGGTVHHAKRPDVDQCAKPVLDVLMHAGFFADDAQVAALAVRKVYAFRPGVEVAG